MQQGVETQALDSGASAGAAAIRLRGIEKRFGSGKSQDKAAALRGIDLDIHDKELLVLLGPSGCGKTTTLNILAGLEEPSGGIIRLGDTVLNDLPPHRRDVAFVFQTYALYPHRTVFGNLAFPLEL